MPILDGRSDDADALMRTPSTDAGAVRSAVSAARAEAPSTGTAATSSPSVGSSRASGPSSADSGSGASSSSCGASSTGWAVCDVASSSAVCASVSAFSVGAAAGASGCAQAALGASDSANTAAIRSDSSFLGISAPPEPARAGFEPMIIGTSLPGPRGTMGRCSDFASSVDGTALPRAIFSPLIGVYGYWHSAGFSPAFPSGSLVGRPAPRPARSILANFYC